MKSVDNYEKRNPENGGNPNADNDQTEMLILRINSPGSVTPHCKSELFSHFRTERLNTVLHLGVNLSKI